MAPMLRTFDDLGYYTLAGAAPDPFELIQEARDGEQLGFGWAFISERFNVKEAATLSGALGAVSSSLQIATAATNHHTRHPIVTAAYATTMHRLTRGRFTLGLGRGIAPLTAALGLPPVTTAQLEDFVGLMRRLWRGETIIGHDGPAGRYPFLRLDPDFDEAIPLGVTAFGPNTLRLGGRAFDHVVLHTFFERRDAPTVRPHRQGRGRPRRSRSGHRQGLVVPGDDRRPPARPGEAEEDGRAHGDLSAGLRRPAGGDEPVGSGATRHVPCRPVHRRLPGSDRPGCLHRRARARRHAHPRTSGWRRLRRARPNAASRSCSASSTSAPTASSSTVRHLPSWPRSSRH